MDINVYAGMTNPRSYICEGCGASGVKLLRLESTDIVLRCFGCAVKKIIPGCQWFPAVPDGLRYWGRRQTPDAGLRWWEALPQKSDSTST